ncbi:hypothetical protein BGW42_005352 [Actinomortierella wolfii]|nr:hypothetical protein BGW42_005352 [Actinomortierella wolfii]
MLSRWLGISPESNNHDSPNDPSVPQIETSQGSMVTATRTRERPTTFQFGDHIHRHLQGLDSFSEFFVRSKSEWVFEGSHPLLLRDGEPEFGMSLSEISHEGRGLKSWDEEFQLNESCPPAVFISNDLAQKVLDAGKALQMMLEHDAQHPLSIATSMKPFRWVFSQKELKDAHQQREEHWRTIILKMIDRLQTKGILTDQSQSMDLDLPADNVSSLPADSMMMFIEQPGQLQAKADFPNHLGDGAQDSYWDPFSHRGELGAFFNYNSMPDASSEATRENTGIHTMGVLLGLTDTQEQEDPQHQQQEYALLPMAVQAQECISYPLKAHVAMIDTCFVSFFFHDMHVLDHWRVVGRFMLMRDGVFVSRLSEALFDDEHGFLEQQLVKAAEYDRRQHGDSSRRKTGAPWPPRGGELEAALRTVLLDSIQATDPTSSLQANDLDEILAFAVKEYDTHTPICRDIHATEALDFLYLDYRPPRPVQMLILQPQIMEKYTRLFTFHLRLLRVHASMRQCFRHLRTLSSLSLAPGKRQSRPQSHVSALKAADLQFLQLFRYEAEQVLEGLRGYLFDTAVGANWVRFMKQMEITKHQIEAQFMAKCTPIHNRQCVSAAAASSEHQQKFPKSNMNEREFEEGDLDDDSVVVDGTKDCLDSLSAIQQSHEQVLEHMLVQALLKRKQRPLLKVVHEVLGCMVQLGKLVRELLQTLEEAAAAGALPKAKNGDIHNDEDMDEEEDIAVKASLLDASVQETMQKVRAQHERFQSACTMLMRVLKALDAQMAAGSSSSFSTSTDSQTSFLKQLMARLGWM